MLRSEQLRQVKQLQSQLEKDGLTVALYDQQGKEIDVEDALGKMKEAEKLADNLGLEMVFRHPTTGQTVRRTPKTTGERKKSKPNKSDGRTRYSNALKRIMKEHGCDRKEAQEIYRKNKDKAQGKKTTAKKSGKSRQKLYVEKVKKIQKDNDCSYREAQEILRAA